MAIGHIKYDRSTNRGSALYQALDKLEKGFKELTAEFGTMEQMKDGASLTSYAVAEYGFLDTAGAEAALAEIGSAKFVSEAAILQMLNKLRN